MQLKAKLVQVMPPQTGEGRNGPWKKQDIIVETDAQYPKKICFSIWGDKIDERYLKPGAILDIHFDVESREYNGRWYTDVKAWKIDPAGADNGYQPDLPPISDLEAPHADNGGDLPF